MPKSSEGVTARLPLREDPGLGTTRPWTQAPRRDSRASLATETHFTPFSGVDSAEDIGEGAVGAAA